MAYIAFMARLALCALALAHCSRHEAALEHIAISDDSDESLANSTAGFGKAFLSVMTWNVEKLDGELAEKTSYVNGVLKKLIGMHQVDVVLLQEARSCDLLGEAMGAAGMDCVDTVVDAAYEAKMSFTVLGGVILFSKAAFDSPAYTHNRATDRSEWSRWLSADDASVKDLGGKTLISKWSESCTWSKYRKGKGCSSIHADIPMTNSVKLYLKPGQFSEGLQGAFAGGVRPVNIHLFSGAKNREISDAAKAAKRAFQMRSLLWLSRVWDLNDEHDLGQSAPNTIYAGDFNTRRVDDLKEVLAPARDYGLAPWEASDSLRTHASGEFLDHVVLSSRPGGAVVRASTEVYDQLGTRGAVNSDHNPMIVKLYASGQGGAGPSAGGQPPARRRPNAWKDGPPSDDEPGLGFEEEEFPTLGSIGQ